MAMRPATPAWRWSDPVDRAVTLETGSADRAANMDAFTRRALELLDETIPR